MYVYFIAIILGFLLGTLVFRYALYKALLGPEEELNSKLKDKNVLDGMAFCYGVNGSIRVWELLALKYSYSWEWIIYGLTGTLLLGLSFVDIRIFELPPEMNAVIASLGVTHIFLDLKRWYVYLIGAVAVSGVFLLIGLFSGGKAMGGGDMKLMAALGLLLGWQKIILVLLIGAVLGCVIHGLTMIVRKKDHVLAFGPYLASGAMIVMLWGQELIDLYIMNMMNIH